MKHLVPLVVLMLGACGGETPDRAANPAADSAADSAAVVNADAPAQRSDGVVPRPADQGQLDRMILAGYTPHGEHMHPPGVKECPLSGGNDAVM